MSARGCANIGDLSGLPTAILYVGCLPLAGCLGVALFALVGCGFVWVWMRVCDWTGLASDFPFVGWRVAGGALLYLALTVPVCVRAWNRPNRTESERAERKVTRNSKSPAAGRPDGVSTPGQEADPPVAPSGVTAGVPQEESKVPTEVDPGEAALRFDGVYVAGTEINDREYDYAGHKYLQYWYFLRFFPDGDVSWLHAASTPEEAFSEMGLGHETQAGGRYTLDGSHLGIRFGATEYYGPVEGLTLNLAIEDDSDMGYSERRYDFAKTGKSAP